MAMGHIPEKGLTDSSGNQVFPPPYYPCLVQAKFFYRDV
jgi:hypothetical protein